ncbi:MAG TPA: hypothetical protein VM328_10355 [Fimbriimonadaceae bacterium]|nr:hypothetical protein [Fimbriimonadaceae bacterium]
MKLNVKHLTYLVAGLALAGCAAAVATRTATPELPEIGGRAVIQPSAPVASRATLVLAGTSIPVHVDQKVQEDLVTLVMKAQKEVIEVEQYRCGSESFALRKAAGEVFEPGLPLLRYPVASGERWSWEGHMTNGSLRQPARAEVLARSEKIYLGRDPWESVKVVVDLEVQADTGTTRRELSFWFVPGKGIVKRSFGPGSARLPQAP